MTVINGYVSLANLKYWLRVTSTDTTDDTVMTHIIEAASRYIDDGTARHFYPTIETRYFSVPDGLDARLLLLDDDLLEIINITNGDSTSVTSSEYDLLPRNGYPKYAIRLKNSVDTFWETNSSGESNYVIAVNAVWGYHREYARAWDTGSTLAEELDISETDWTMTAGTNFAADQIVRVENELSIISSVAEAVLTVLKRGDNRSTAATHATAKTVTIWHPYDVIRQCAELISVCTYRNRFGENAQASAIITGAGVVLTPEDIPDSAKAIINTYRKMV